MGRGLGLEYGPHLDKGMSLPQEQKPKAGRHHVRGSHRCSTLYLLLPDLHRSFHCHFQFSPHPSESRIKQRLYNAGNRVSEKLKKKNLSESASQ